MLIGELAKLTGLSRDTIRFYEKQGLFQASRKDLRFNNYKEYSVDVLEKLRTVKRLKHFGFTLGEAAEYLALIEHNQASCGSVSARMNQRVEAIDQKIAQLQQLRNLLTQSVTDCLNCRSARNTAENCPILTTDCLLEK
jgi:DNA-binding transcriptional MerR regulator